MTTGPLIIFLLAEERRKAEAAAALAMQETGGTHSTATGSETLSSTFEREGSARSTAKDKPNESEV